MYRGLRVAVVIPAYNEERLIGRTIVGVPDFVDRIYVVDDASSDATAAATEACADPRVRLHRRSTNGGVGQAILDGYALAAADGADVVVVMGGDAQMEPTEMPRLLDPIVDDEADYVKGDRLSHPQLFSKMPLLRIIGNYSLTWLTRLALNEPRLRDSQCGYSAIRTDLAARLNPEKMWRRYGFPNDLLASLLDLGARVKDVPVTPIYGEENSGIRLSVAVPTLLFVLGRAWWRRHRGGKKTP